MLYPDRHATYLAKAFGLGMLFETESGEVGTLAEDLCLRKNTDTTDTINLHLHVWIAVRIAQIGQMRSPCSVLGISFNNNSVLVEGVGKRKGRLGFLPGVQVVWLFSTQPVGKRTPDV
jgi:hypothetical protein